MKKIFSLFLLAIATVAMHAAPGHLMRLDNSASNREMSMKQARAQKAFHEAQCDINKGATVSTLASETMEAESVRRAIQSSLQADPIVHLEIDGFLLGPEYEAETNEWYVAMGAQDYVFRLCWYANANDFTGTFTIKDFDLEDSYGWYETKNASKMILYEDVNMTVSSKVVSEHLKQIIIDATIVDTARCTYQLHAVHSMYTPKQTIQHHLTNTKVNVNEGKVVLDGDNTDLDVVLNVNSEVIEGVFTHTDFDMSSTKIVYKGIEQKIIQASLTIMQGELENKSLGYYVDLSFYNQDTVLHKVYMPASLPEPKETIRVTCTNLDVDDSFCSTFGVVMLTGDNADYDIFAMYPGTSAEPGVYNQVAVTINDKITWQPVESITGQLILKEDDKGWHAHIETYAADYNLYVIDMSFVIPTPTKTVSVKFDTCALATYNMYDDHMIQLLTEGKEYEAAVTVYGVKPGEKFSIENVLMNYTGIYDVDGGFTVRIADINGTLDQKKDTTIITASVIGFNAIQYDVELWYVAPTPVDTVEIDMPIKFTNNLKDGYYTLSGYTPDPKWYIALSPVAEEVAGQFVNDGVFGKFGTGGRYEFFAGNTFVYSAEEQMNYPVEKGEMTVTMDEDGKITAVAKIICRNSVYFHITMTSEYNEYLDFDEPYADLERYYTTEDVVMIDNQIKSYYYVYFSVTAADSSDMASFFFYVDREDPDIVIPEGVYTIDYSEDFGTVQANPGVQGNGVWPSYYAELMEDGSLVTPLWLMVEGTVEVKKDKSGNPHLIVDAKNSYGRKVYIEYDGSTADVENVVADPVDVEKKVVNGQMLIIRDGKTYNVLGIKM